MRRHSFVDELAEVLTDTLPPVLISYAQVADRVVDKTIEAITEDLVVYRFPHR